MGLLKPKAPKQQEIAPAATNMTIEDEDSAKNLINKDRRRQGFASTQKGSVNNSNKKNKLGE